MGIIATLYRDDQAMADDLSVTLGAERLPSGQEGLSGYFSVPPGVFVETEKYTLKTADGQSARIAVVDTTYDSFGGIDIKFFFDGPPFR